MKLLTAIALLFVFGCNTKKESQPDAQPENQFETDYPAMSLPDDPFRKQTNTLIQYMNLEMLNKPTDGFMMRIWIYRALSIGTHVFEIKNKNDNWRGVHYYFREPFPSDEQGKSSLQSPTDTDSFWVAKHFTPASGWNGFMDSTINNGILTLPDYRTRDSCNIKGGADGTMYILEWSNKKLYRYYSFWADSESTCIENQRFRWFQSYFARQLDMNYCWPECSGESGPRK